MRLPKVFPYMQSTEPFLAQVSHPGRSDLVYLSYVTLTTVGFGDLTPKSDIARTLVITEALVGAHSGFTRKRVKRTPSRPMASMFGVSRSVFQNELASP